MNRDSVIAAFRREAEHFGISLNEEEIKTAMEMFSQYNQVMCGKDAFVKAIRCIDRIAELIMENDKPPELSQ